MPGTPLTARLAYSLMLLVLLLVALFLLVLLGFYVFVSAPRSRTHQTFAAFLACLALWTIKDIAFWGFPEDGAVSWWVSASFIISLLLQYALVIFAWVFPEDRRIPLRRAAALFAPGMVLVPAAILGWMWTDARLTEGRFTIHLTLLAYAFGLYLYALFAYGFGLLYVKHRRYRGQLWGKQLGAILWALILTATLNTVASIVLPLLGVNTLLEASAIFVLPGVFVYAYAISNFKLFSLQSALDQFRLFPIAYKVALSIAVVAILSFLLLQVPIVWWSFGTGPTGDAWRRYLVFSVITALVPNLLLVALIIRTISRPVRRLTESAVEVAGGAYGTQVKLESNDEMGLLAASFNEMSRKMASDIERLRELNEHLIRAEKLAAAGTLAAGVAHEVNNPLASISSLIQMLQAREHDPEKSEQLRLISTQIERITQVLREMMEFAGTRPPERVPLDINRVVDASLRLASFDKAFQRLRINKSFDAGAPLIRADANQLQQVFLNILLNARDAMPGGGDLDVRTRYDFESEEVLVEIRDDGAGIAPEHAAHIFDPFFTTKPAGAGTGLGLAVSYRIVTAHGGRIEVAPNNGRGTTVRVRLPEESRELTELTHNTNRA